MISPINYVGVILQLVGYGVAATVLALAKALELDLRLMVGYRGVLGAPCSLTLLLDSIEKAEGVSKRLEVIKVGPFSDLALEVLVAAPRDGGEILRRLEV